MALSLLPCMPMRSSAEPAAPTIDGTGPPPIHRHTRHRAFDQLGGLSGAIDGLKTAGTISELARLKMQKQVSDTRQLDSRAIMGLTNPQTLTDGQIQRDLDKAAGKKRSLLRKLTMAKALLK